MGGLFGKTMEFIVWRDEYNINISKMDTQHQNLAGLMNDLNEAVAQKMEMTALMKKLSDIVSYTRKHFDTEEELMRSNDYPDYSEHKQEHDALISYLEDAENRLRMGKKFNFYTNFNVSCDCFITHMDDSDKKLGMFLNSRDIY